MGSKKKPSLPAAPPIPEYKEDPAVRERIDEMYGLGKSAVGMDFSGNEAMQEVINTSPQMTSLFLQGLKSQLDPQFDDMRRDTINTLAAQGQLDSSVLTSSMADIEKNKQNQYIQQSTQFGINDISRAMGNRMSLYGTGLETMKYGTQATMADRDQFNKFNLQNYGNAAKKWDMEAASTMWDYQPTGGWRGAVQGLGGGIFGAAAGYYGEPGLGSDITSMASNFASMGMGSMGSGGGGGSAPSMGSMPRGGGGASPFTPTSAGSSAGAGRLSSSYGLGGGYNSSRGFSWT